MNREAWWVLYSPWGREESDINHHHHHGFGSCCQSTPCPPSSPGIWTLGGTTSSPSIFCRLILPPASHLSGYCSADALASGNLCFLFPQAKQVSSR